MRDRDRTGLQSLANVQDVLDVTPPDMRDTRWLEAAASPSPEDRALRTDFADLLERGPGKHLSSIVLAGGTADAKEQIPIALLTGTRPGPTAWINASLHGDEYLGPAAIGELLERLASNRIRGRVLLTPTLNPTALRAMQREDPERRADWNRIWADDPSRPGVPAAIAWARSELLTRADIVLDLHSGGNRFFQVPFAVYSKVGGAVDSRASALAKACGLPYIWAHRRGMLDGALITAAAQDGKAAALLEIGGEGKVEPAELREVVAAAEGALSFARILRGRPRFLRTYRVFEDYATVRTRHEGRWTRLVEPGTRVRRGQPIGRVLDLLGQEIELVRSPVSALVCGVCTYGYVAADDYAAELASRFHTETRPR